MSENSLEFQCAQHWPKCHMCGKECNCLPKTGPMADHLHVTSFDPKKKDHDKLVCRACHPILSLPDYRWPR